MMKMYSVCFVIYWQVPSLKLWKCSTDRFFLFIVLTCQWQCGLSIVCSSSSILAKQDSMCWQHIWLMSPFMGRVKKCLMWQCNNGKRALKGPLATVEIWGWSLYKSRIIFIRLTNTKASLVLFHKSFKHGLLKHTQYSLDESNLTCKFNHLTFSLNFFLVLDLFLKDHRISNSAKKNSASSHSFQLFANLFHFLLTFHSRILISIL